MKAVVIDTNVAIAANGKHPPAGPECVKNCIHALRTARQQLVLVDDGYHILDEYRHNLSPKGQPGPGDAFFKWLWDNKSNPNHCRQVAITPLNGSETNFAEFPADPGLAQFDPSDRKFIAVALGSRLDPKVLEATDSKWWPLRELFQRNGVRVEFLCPELMKERD